MNGTFCCYLIRVFVLNELSRFRLLVRHYTKPVASYLFTFAGPPRYCTATHIMVVPRANVELVLMKHTSNQFRRRYY